MPAKYACGGLCIASEFVKWGSEVVGFDLVDMVFRGSTLIANYYVSVLKYNKLTMFLA